MSETLTERTVYLPEILAHTRLVVATVFSVSSDGKLFHGSLARLGRASAGTTTQVL